MFEGLFYSLNTGREYTLWVKGGVKNGSSFFWPLSPGQSTAPLLPCFKFDGKEYRKSFTFHRKKP
jgi:hypothetical protein